MFQTQTLSRLTKGLYGETLQIYNTEILMHIRNSPLFRHLYNGRWTVWVIVFWVTLLLINPS